MKRCPEPSSPWFASACSACPSVIPASRRSASSETKRRTSTRFMSVFAFDPPSCIFQIDADAAGFAAEAAVGAEAEGAAAAGEPAASAPVVVVLRLA